jgi:Na+-transporting NADH:ubiquinone oxidoreductase subunit E
MTDNLFIIFLNIFFTAAIVENVLLYYFLGTCPLISISDSLEASLQMGVTVTFVMVITACTNNIIYNYVLAPYNLEYLYLLFFILVIAAVTQFLEALLDRFFPAVYTSFGIFLSLIVVNCAILGVAMFSMLREYNLFTTAIYSLGSGLGWTFVICVTASVKKRISFDKVPSQLGKIGVTMVIAAILAMAFGGVAEFISGVGL